MILAVNLLLWGLVAMLAATAARRGSGLLHDGVREGFYEFVRLSPRIFIGVIGSGFIAAVLPRELIGAWLGPHSGIAGLSSPPWAARSRRAARWSASPSARPRSRAAPAPRR